MKINYSLTVYFFKKKRKVQIKYKVSNNRNSNITTFSSTCYLDDSGYTYPTIFQIGFI